MQGRKTKLDFNALIPFVLCHGLYSLLKLQKRPVEVYIPVKKSNQPRVNQSTRGRIVRYMHWRSWPGLL